jgi:hypothetical protein
MSVLLYCVFPASGERPALRGVDGRPVHYVRERRLCAATSFASSSRLAPTIERVRTHESVVEDLFAKNPVIPMRYGSIVPSNEDVTRFLRARQDFFGHLLTALSGQVEMGIRIAEVPRMRPAARPPVRRTSGGPGHAYLLSRDEHRTPADRSPDFGRAIDMYRTAFQNLYTDFKAEPSLPMNVVLDVFNGRLRISERKSDRASSASSVATADALALYFLVPGDRVGAFRERFRELKRVQKHQRLSGPWPPYNFVAQIPA